MSENTRINIGLAERVITPPLGVKMGGFAARKGVAEGVHDDLHARAMVVEGPETAVAILSASVIGLDQEIVDGVRKAVEQQTGLSGAHILMAPTHTHSGPTASDEYSVFLRERCIECLVDAWECREQRRLGIGIGHTEDVGRNRRRLSYGGLPVDPEVGIIKIENTDGKIKGLLFNYTCHPTTMGPDNLQITEDWAYYTIRTIKERVGTDTVVMFVNGAEGDINPDYGSGLSAIGAPIPIRTFLFAEKIGVRLAHAVLDALPDIKTRAAFPIQSVSKRIDLPFRSSFPLTLEEAAARRKDAQANFEQQEPDISYVQKHDAEIAVFFAGMVYNRAEEFYSDNWEPSISVELQSIRLDDAALTSFPGEVFVEVGLEVKKRSPFSKTLVIGLANGRSGGYLPTKETYTEGDYEVVAAKYSEAAAEVLIEATVEQLEGMV